MDLISYALARKAMAQAGAASAQISSMEIENGRLIVILTDGKRIDAGELPTASQPIIEQIQSDVKELQDNSITSVFLNGEEIKPENNILKLPLASGDIIGLVKGTLVNSENSENKISINDDGTMEVISLNINKLSQNDDDMLILNCNSAT